MTRQAIELHEQVAAAGLWRQRVGWIGLRVIRLQCGLVGGGQTISRLILLPLRLAGARAVPIAGGRELRLTWLGGNLALPIERMAGRTAECGDELIASLLFRNVSGPGPGLVPAKSLFVGP